MEKLDLAVIASGLVVSFAAAYWAQVNGLTAADLSVTGTLSQLSILIVFIASIFAYLAKGFYGGSIARSLTVTATGFFIYALIWWPHKIWWHGGGTPAWFGIIEPAWQTFFHLFTGVTLLIAAYGFYLFWQSAPQRGDAA